MKKYNSAFELMTDDEKEIEILSKKADMALKIRDKYDAGEIQLVSEEYLNHILSGRITKVSIEEMEKILE
mgnify:CR=1 FL=1|tara:strand:- start:154 stop:363 length:210 start_codon:yes stop_codon:yes gene_type:complete